MIVNVRLEVTDEQRRVLSRRSFPDSPARMSTRKEFNEWVNTHLADLDRVQLSPDMSTESVQTVQDSNPVQDSPVFDVIEQPEDLNSTKYVKLLFSITNAMHSMTNAAMIAKQVLSPNDAQPFRDCRAKITDLRYEIADKHDAEMESQL